MGFDDIEGQDAALGALQGALAADRLSQSYLFEGPSGVGKQKTALALASALICPEGGCGGCRLCRRIVEGNHPDVRVFPPRPDGNHNLPVELLRNEILPFAKFAPFEASAAFLIFPSADICFPVQHPEAANALLKTLEEPKKTVHFLLLSERPDRLLPTIRSRCQRIRFGRLPQDLVERILEREGVAPSARRLVAALSAGRADLALSLAAEGRGGLLLDWTRRIDSAVRKGRAGALLDLSEELCRHDDRDLVLATLALFYRDVAAAQLKLPRDTLALGEMAQEVLASAGRTSASRAAEHVARIQQTVEDLERNANPQVALDAMLCALR